MSSKLGGAHGRQNCLENARRIDFQTILWHSVKAV